MSYRYYRMMTQPTEREVRRSKAQAKYERQIRDIKDLVGTAYMGKNE